MIGGVGWLFLLLQLGLETLTPGECGPETQLCQFPKRDKFVHVHLRVHEWCVRAYQYVDACSGGVTETCMAWASSRSCSDFPSLSSLSHTH